jgi:zinc transporter 1/2/3
VSAVNGIILCIAIGVHEFFEGIAFGLMKSTTQAGQLAAGILIHKAAAAISLGGTFSRTGFSFRQILICLSLFSISAPIGIIIGMNLSESNYLVDTIFMSVAGGTFIYVACSEIIVHEFSRGGHGFIKLLLVILGIAVITLLWLMDGGHSHGGEHDSHAEEEEAFVPECLTWNRRDSEVCDEWSV